nr:hypothetical protein [Bacillota bacterium]
MTIFNKIKDLFKKDPTEKKSKPIDLTRVSVFSMEKKFEAEDLVGAAKDLKLLLESYGRSKKKNHRYKGREFIFFI